MQELTKNELAYITAGTNISLKTGTCVAVLSAFSVYGVYKFAEEYPSLGLSAVAVFLVAIGAVLAPSNQKPNDAAAAIIPVQTVPNNDA